MGSLAEVIPPPPSPPSVWKISCKIVPTVTGLTYIQVGSLAEVIHPPPSPPSVSKICKIVPITGLTRSCLPPYKVELLAITEVPPQIPPPIPGDLDNISFRHKIPPNKITGVLYTTRSCLPRSFRKPSWCSNRRRNYVIIL